MAVAEFLFDEFAVEVHGSVVLDGDVYIIDGWYPDTKITFDGHYVDFGEMSYQMQKQLDKELAEWEKQNQMYLRSCWEEENW